MESVTAVVPTLGRSPLLVECLAALRDDGGDHLDIVVVHPADSAPTLSRELGAQALPTSRSLGFAAASNLGLGVAETSLVAVVNDDVIVRSPWLGPLTAALGAEAELAAVQGTNLDQADCSRIDGYGLAWNRRWQAVQLGHHRPIEEAPSSEREIFGVSGTAALFRREALHAAALSKDARGPFDETLESYYEDVDLACRLRAAGFRARCEPRAVCLHRGATTAPPVKRHRLVYRNRYLVLARLLGRSFWQRLPFFIIGDLRELAGAIARGRHQHARGLLAGLAQVPLHLPHFSGLGPPMLPISDIRRLGALE